MAKLLCDTGPKGVEMSQLEPLDAKVGREELQVLGAHEVRSGLWRQFLRPPGNTVLFDGLGDFALWCCAKANP